MSQATNNTQHIIEAEILSADIKEYFEEHLMGKQYVEMISFPHGDKLQINSFGDGEVRDYKEDQQIKYSTLDTGQFEFEITEYVSSAYSITDKLRQDAIQGQLLQSKLEPKMRRALEERMEADIWKVIPSKQTAGDSNTINSGKHRFVGTGANDTIALEDFAYANYVFNKANVPNAGRVAIVDPSIEFELNTLTGITNVVNNPKWEGVISTGMSDSVRFLYNIYGFDIYVSNYLQKGLNDTIDGNTVTDAVANVFMASAPDKKPMIGAMRQEPKVESERNKDFQRGEFVLTARYGFDLYHPESVITVLTDYNQVRP